MCGEVSASSRSLAHHLLVSCLVKAASKSGTRARCPQKYIGGNYQLPEETEQEDAAAGMDGKKHQHRKGKRLAVTSLLRSEPTAVAETPGAADTSAADDAELTDESLDAEDVPTLAAIEPQGPEAVQHYPLWLADEFVRGDRRTRLFAVACGT